MSLKTLGSGQLASADPPAEFAAKVASRLAVDGRTRVSIPGDPSLAQSVTWSKQDLADLTQQADDVHIRDTEEGTVYPAPLATLPSIRFEGAGFPDYPRMFATDQEYTMFALLAAGQFATAEAGLRSLEQVSVIANHDSGKVVHEAVTDGSVYFGLNDEPGDIDETAKFPDAVAMVWRWTGDNGFRDEMYRFVVKNMQYMIGLTSGDDDLWPDGSGNEEATGLGPTPSTWPCTRSAACTTWLAWRRARATPPPSSGPRAMPPRCRAGRRSGR